MKTLYTHDMLTDYISSNAAADEAYNYIAEGMTDVEIRADIESCLADCVFEVDDDRDTYIALILEAAARLRG